MRVDIHKNVLAVNAGSSSVKLAYFSTQGTTLTHIADLQVNGIGSPQTVLNLKLRNQEPVRRTLHASTMQAATEELLKEIAPIIPIHTVTAIGHRIVHGGPDFDQPVVIDHSVETTLQSLSRFNPNHAPAALRLLHILRQHYHHAVHIACFDTAFFHDLPEVAQQIALPHRYKSLGLRRYGFHGLSYTFLLKAFRDIAGEQAAQGRIIIAHLGSGASLAAIRHGTPVDTTMGLTPASGIIMSSRSGDIDPGVATFLHEQAGIDFAAYNRMVNFESGLLGISGISADMHTLIEHEQSNPRAAEAIEAFCYTVRKAIGSLATTIGGVDSLIFSGGIGEQSSLLRQRICTGLDFLGIKLDPEQNDRHRDLISATDSRAGVHVLATNEAQIIAEQTLDTINKSEDI